MARRQVQPCRPEHETYDGSEQLQGGAGVGGGGEGAGGGGGGVYGIMFVEPRRTQPPLVTEPSELHDIMSPAFIWTFEGPPLPDQR